MSSYRLDRLFEPRSIALLGASPREKSVGRLILKNLRDAGFAGGIQLVNPNYAEIEGIAAVKSADALPVVPDMAVIASPPPTIPAAVAALAAKGCAVGVIITSGLGHGPGSLAEATRQAAHAHGMRLVGPNCLGIIVPRAKLNATFAARMPMDGDLALISQSGAIAAGLIEWAAQRKDRLLGHRLDRRPARRRFRRPARLLRARSATRARSCSMSKSIKDARKFMSAARAAARTKPVVVVKAGRHARRAPRRRHPHRCAGRLRRGL